MHMSLYMTTLHMTMVFKSGKNSAPRAANEVIELPFDLSEYLR